MPNDLEIIIGYINRHDPFKKAVDRSEAMAYYLNIRLTDPIEAFSKTRKFIDDRLNNHMDLGSDKYP